MKFHLGPVLMLLFGTSLAAADDACDHDREALLALDETAFDQDLSNGGGGWRSLANMPGCQTVAADLIAAYRAKHGSTNSTLLWHEGQLRAMAGDAEGAIPLLSAARRDDAADKRGWNAYVDATVAFLRQDKDQLLQAKDRLAAVPYVAEPGSPPLKDGYFEVPTSPGQPPFRMRWPPNIEVVEGFVACFGEPYAKAYGMECRNKAAAN